MLFKQLFNRMILMFGAGLTVLLSTMPASTENNESSSISYGLTAGADLIFSATLDTVIEGPYSEQSTRILESRFVAYKDPFTGIYPTFGISCLKRRILEGQEVDLPFENREAYLFNMTPHGEFFGYETDSPELGTGWTPMIHFPPLPKKTISFDTRTEANFPVYCGFPEAVEGRYSMLIRNIDPQNNKILIGASLVQPVTIKKDYPVSIVYQEHEIRFDVKKGFPDYSRTSTQVRMKSPTGTFNIEIIVESRLKQANVFPEKYHNTIRKQVSQFFELKSQLQSVEMSDSTAVLEELIDYSENSPLPFMRKTAGDLVLKYRYNMRLNQNETETNQASQAPSFSGETIQGKLIRFPPEQRKPTLLFFWALWWEPAERELWQMEALYQAYKDDVHFIGINLDNTKGIIRRYVLQGNIELPILWDEGYPEQGIAFRYGIRTVPTIVILNKRGKIAGRDIIGDELNELLEKLSR